MFLSDNFEDKVLYEPARIDTLGCESLKIITGYTDCERISTHLIGLKDGIDSHEFTDKMSVDIILGMTKSAGGLTQKKHDNIRRLISYLKTTRNMPSLSCKYIYTGREVHSKVYIWSRRNIPKIAYCGSVNYTMSAFRRRRECIADCDADAASFYYHTLLNDCIDCSDPLALNLVKESKATIIEPDYQDTEEKDYEYYNGQKPLDSINVSLLTAKSEETGHGSGINWGIRQNGTKRNKNQAYIPYNKKDKKEGFFPDRIHADDKNCPIFRVITKDFGEFHMRMAQQNNKAIHSAESNAIIGEWIRKKIGVAPETFVTKQMLENYGRTYVTFRKYNDNIYLLDF